MPKSERALCCYILALASSSEGVRILAALRGDLGREFFFSLKVMISTLYLVSGFGRLGGVGVDGMSDRFFLCGILVTGSGKVTHGEGSREEVEIRVYNVNRDLPIIQCFLSWAIFLNKAIIPRVSAYIDAHNVIPTGPVNRRFCPALKQLLNT